MSETVTVEASDGETIISTENVQESKLESYGELIVNMKSSDLPLDYYRSFFSSKKNCFTGRDIVMWLVKHRDVEYKDATALADRLISIGVVVEYKNRKRAFNVDNRYRLIIDTEQNGVLNVFHVGENFAVDYVCAVKAANNLRIAITGLYTKFLNEYGSQIDYEQLQRSKEFNVDYRNAVYMLKFAKLIDLNDVERKCFFINIYNTLMINGLLVYGKPRSILQKKNFYNICKYNIGGHLFSLNDIEHGVLRANRKPVGALKRCFGGKDIRRMYITTLFDPRIHFALNCGAKSCPPIRAYVPEKLDYQLDLASRNFCDGEVVVDEKNKVVSMSKIFQWYKDDFGNSDVELLNHVRGYIDDKEIRDSLVRLLQTGKVRVKYHYYDWSLNELDMSASSNENTE
ncbi:egl-10 [Acrasis kona]|uniref:Egl-10 n=1 Tax=Acrasis kona TaxID=1008807 RepID=A0AAW2ZAW0_9EUKA